MASTIVTNSDPLTGFFRYSEIEPTPLTSGQSYVVTAVTLGEQYTRDPINFTVDPRIEFLGDRWASSTSLVFPDTTSNETGYFGANIRLGDLNGPPTADAGGHYTINEGDSVSFDATGSFDPDGDALAYSWDINGDGVFGDATSATPTLNWAQLDALGINDNGTYTVVLRVDDGNGAQDTATTTLTVNNVAPALSGLALSDTNIDEGESTTLSGSIADAGSADTFTVEIDWDGDGAADEMYGNVAAGPFSYTHMYADDDPAGTSSDTYAVGITVTDDDGAAASQAGASSSTTLSAVSRGWWGSNGEHTSGNGNTYTGRGGSVDYNSYFTFDSSGVSSALALVLRLELQSYLGSDASETFSVWDVSTNAAALEASGTDVGIYQDLETGHSYGSASAGPEDVGSIIDIPLDAQSVSDFNDSAEFFSVGVSIDSLSNPDYYESLRFSSGNEFRYHLLAIDAAPLLEVTVNNVAPQNVSAGADQTVDEGDTVNLSGSFTDPGSADTHSLLWQVSDSNGQTVADGTGANFSFVPPDNGTYTVSFTVTDDDGGVSAATTVAVTVNNVAPTVTLEPVTTIDENGFATLTGTITDIGTLDGFNLQIDWGDSESSSISGADILYGTLQSPWNVSRYNAATDSSTLFIAGAMNPTGVTQEVKIGLDGRVYVASRANNTVSRYDPDTGAYIDTVAGPNDGLFSPDFIEFGSDGLMYVGNGPSLRRYDPANGFAFVEAFAVSGSGDGNSAIGPDGNIYFTALGGQVQRFNLATDVVDVFSMGVPSPYGLDFGPDGNLYVSNFGDTGTITRYDGSTGSYIDTFISGISYPGEIEFGPDGDLYIAQPLMPGDLGRYDGTTGQFTETIVSNGFAGTLSFEFVTQSTTETISVAPNGTGTVAFSVTHQYLDDNPTATPSDPYTVSVAATDDDGGFSTVVMGTVTVANVAPVVASVNLNQATIDENGSVTVSGSVSDVGSLDTHTVSIDFGDGSAPVTVAVDPATRTYSASHQYLDDDPTATPSDQYTISVTATDDDGGVSASVSAMLEVSNVAPQLSGLAVTSLINETGFATLTGEITDLGTQDTFTLTVDWGDPLSPNNTETIDLANPPAHMTWDPVTRHFSVSHQYLDDNPTGTSSDTYTVTIVGLVDDDGGAAVLTDHASVTSLVGDLSSTNFDNAKSPVFSPVFANEVTFSAAATVSSYAHAHGGSVDIFVDIRNSVTGLWTNIFQTTLTGSANFYFAGRTFSFTPQSVDQIQLRSNLGVNQTFHGWSDFSIDFAGITTASVTVNNLPPTANGNMASVDEDGPSVAIPVLANDTDPAGAADPLVVTGVVTDGFDTRGLVSFTSVGIGYDPNGQFESLAAGETATDSLSYTISDGDGGTATANVLITIEGRNDAPVAADVSETTNEDAGTFTLDANLLVSDVDASDVLAITSIVQDSGCSIIFDSTGGVLSFNANQFNDLAVGESKTLTFTYTVDDQEGQANSTSTGILTVIVTGANDAPVIGSVTSTAYYGGNVAAGEVVTITADFSDADLSDTHSAVIHWGDGTSTSAVITESAGEGVLEASRVYANGGVYEITITLEDAFGGADVSQTQAVITGAGVVGDALYIVGTGGRDEVHLNTIGGGYDWWHGRRGPDELRVHADFFAREDGHGHGHGHSHDKSHGKSHGGSDSWRDFELGTFSRIVVLMGDSNDKVTVAGNIDIDLLIDGGAGNDELHGGHGASILLGGDGDDHLHGGHSRNLLIGGRGSDELKGEHQDDILVAGYSVYDSSETVDGLPAEEGLFAMLAEWQSGRDFATRRDNLIGLGSAALPRENDDYFLRLGQEVFEDLNRDRVKDGKGRDWVLEAANPSHGSGSDPGQGSGDGSEGEQDSSPLHDLLAWIFRNW